MQRLYSLVSCAIIAGVPWLLCLLFELVSPCGIVVTLLLLLLLLLLPGW
jgi:hypothetical protein